VPETDTRVVPAAAPRLDPRLVDLLERLARSEASYAEIRRGLVARARELGIPPPSYEHVRRLVTRYRLDRELEPTIVPVAVGVALGTRHGNELVRALRDGPPSRGRTKG
jgi:hypothetical protein